MIRALISLLRREFALFWNHSVLRLLFIGAPLGYGLVFGFVYQKGKVTDLPILVVDQDATPLSEQLIDMLHDHEVLQVLRVPAASPSDLHRQLIASEGQALLVIPERFEADILQGRTPEVRVHITLANMLTANYASRAIQVVLGSLNAGLEMESLRKRGTPEYAAREKYQAFSTHYLRLHNPSSNYMVFLWPGMLATIVQQVLLLALALSFAREIEQGTLHGELFARTRSTAALILIKCLPFWFMLIPMGGCFWLFQEYFRVPLIPEAWGAALLLSTLFIIATSLLGILVSLLVPNQLKATEILMVVATPAFVLSGFTWPISQMPAWLGYLAKKIPLTHFLEGYRILLVQGGTLADLGQPVRYLAILSVAFGALSYALLKRRHRLPPSVPFEKTI